MEHVEKRRMLDGTEYQLLDASGHAVHYLIEHRTRGCYTGFDNHRSTGEWQPIFRRSDAIHRNSPEVWHGYSLAQTEVELAKVLRWVKDAYVVRIHRPRMGR